MALANAVLESILPRLRAFAYSMAGTDGDDVVQETVARALTRDLDDDPDRIRAYLFQIAANLCRDRHRRRRRETDAMETLARRGEERDPMTRERAALWAGVRRLPAVQREVFLLRHSGMKFGEIAAMLEIPLNTALGRMHDAIQRLRKELADDRV